jgi:hypothetical protein
MTQRSNRQLKAGNLRAWLRSVFSKPAAGADATRQTRKLTRIADVVAKVGREPAQES